MTATTALDIEASLKKWFGYNTFRPHQKEIIEGILNNNDVVAILPTGAGKSLCYQLPAMIMDGTAIVVSPLISLMQDQVSALAKTGIPAAFVNSSLPIPLLHDIIDNLSTYKLLYIAPERFADINFLNRLKETRLSFFVIDEAHCISQWGHSFRPDYRGLSIIKKTFPNIPLMALTATATQEVESDIIDQLSMKSPLLNKGSFDRPNLFIRVVAKMNPYDQILNFLKERKDQSGIIYATTRKTVDNLYDDLKQAGYNVGKYHAGLNDRDRATALHDFIHDKTPLIVATVAFGMGINKPDVRFILHHDMPKNIEQYYQEIGRAGRDGLPSECLMLYSGQELMTYRFFLKDIEDPIVRNHNELMTDRMYSFCLSYHCRRKGLLNYFGEKYLSTDCNSCDNCVDGEGKIDGTVIAQKILSCVFRVKERFGLGHVVNVLRGAKTQQVFQHGHDELSTYNLLPEIPFAEMRYYIDSLITMDFLQVSKGDYPLLQLTESSWSVLKGETKVVFRKKLFKSNAKDASQTQDPAFNTALFNKLRQLRLSIANAEEMPPFTIFSDRTLMEMATYFPQNDYEMLAINGVGRFKLDSYGREFILEIKEFCSKNGIKSKSQGQSHSPPRNQQQKALGDSAKLSGKLFNEGKSIEEIASIRKLSASTIFGHICQKIEEGEVDEAVVNLFVPKEKQDIINKAIDQVGSIEKLTPIKEILTDIDYNEIRLVIAARKHKNLHKEVF